MGEAGSLGGIAPVLERGGENENLKKMGGWQKGGTADFQIKKKKGRGGRIGQESVKGTKSFPGEKAVTYPMEGGEPTTGRRSVLNLVERAGQAR